VPAVSYPGRPRNNSIEEKSKDIVNKSESKAKAESDLVEAKEDKEAVMLELEQLANYKAELHSSCDCLTDGKHRYMKGVRLTRPSLIKSYAAIKCVITQTPHHIYIKQ
jgi:hypothetical protein